jgi:hypothetical protein
VNSSSRAKRKTAAAGAAAVSEFSALRAQKGLLVPKAGASIVGGTWFEVGVRFEGMTRLVFFGMTFGASPPGVVGGAIGAPGALQPAGAAPQQVGADSQQP